MKTYIGITIGPIIRVQNYAKKTRGVWASSYIFSYMAENIVGKYFKDGNEFLKPTLNEEMFTIKDGVGRFPDQYIFEKGEKDSLDLLRNECDDLLRKLACNIALVTKSNEYDVRAYLKRTIKIILFEQEFAESKSKEDIVGEMQQTMNIMECRDSFCAEEGKDENYLERYIESASKESLLVFERNLEFETILECSSCREFTEDDKGHVISKGNTQCNTSLEPYQKYIAVVCGDGDNFGKTLARHGAAVADVFKTINNNVKAKIQDFKGQLIYQGGDDLYFIAPVYNPARNKDIFSLIKEISDEVQKEIDKSECIKNDREILKNPSLKPSMSFGVSISYYKFPIAETRMKANELLEEIKNVDSGVLKNKINWCVRKHSGQTFQSIIDKNKVGELDNFISLIGDISAKKQKSDKDEESNFLHSVTYWVGSDATMLSYILRNENRKTLLENYRDANFNEDEHTKYESFLKDVVSYLLNCEGDSGLKKLNAILRYITLLLKED